LLALQAVDVAAAVGRERLERSRELGRQHLERLVVGLGIGQQAGQAQAGDGLAGW